MASCGMFRRMAIVRTDVSGECIVSIMRVTRTTELGRTLAVSSNRSTLLCEKEALVWDTSARVRKG
jgi:hypothetical protein